MLAAVVTSKGQITIPPSVRRKLGLDTDDRVAGMARQYRLLTGNFLQSLQPGGTEVLHIELADKGLSAAYVVGALLNDIRHRFGHLISSFSVSFRFILPHRPRPNHRF